MSPSRREVALYGALGFFLLQLTASFAEGVYAFGLLAVDVPPGIALATLAFIAPLGLLAFRERFPRWLEVGLGLALLAASLAEAHLAHLPRVLVGGLGVAAGISLLAVMARARTGERFGGLGVALALGALGSGLMRAVGSGLDASRRGLGVIVAAVLAVLAGWLLLDRARRPDDASDDAAARGDGGMGFGRVLVLAVGMTSALATTLYGFMAPGVIARWVAADEAAVAGVVAASWAVAIALPAIAPRLVSPRSLAVLTLLFAALLAVALRAHQPALSPSASYPVEAAAPGWAAAPLWAALGLSGVVPLSMSVLTGALGHASPRKIAGAFAASGVLLLLFVTAQILTTIYDYIPVVGPLLRDRFWLVTAMPAACVAAALPLAPARPPPVVERAAWIAAGVLGLLTAIASVLLAPSPMPRGSWTGADGLRVVSFNIQQGFSKEGAVDIDAQLAVLKRLDADVIGLQESDSARLAGGNQDRVRFLANELGMYADYGPSPVSGTFGVAVLSRLPLRSARTVFLESRGEQTAAVIVAVEAGGALRHVAVTHLGNDGDQSQLDDTLEALGTAPSVVLTGDFNFTASSPQHRTASDRLGDAWLAAAARTGERFPDDLDHVFTSRGLSVRAVGYERSNASDHPAVWVEVGF